MINNFDYIYIRVKVLYMDFIRQRLTTKRKQGQEENLIEYQNKKIYQVFKNRLFLTSFINLLTFLDFVFSMCYFNWGSISVPTFISTDAAESQRVTYTIYFNLLYVK